MEMDNQFWTVLSYLHSLAGPVIMLLYPLYASVQAVESPSKLDDEQWLAYWILYSFLTLLEMMAEPVLYWIPIWYEIKVVFVAWLVLPMFRGSAFVYVKLVRERLLMRGEGQAVAASHPSGAAGGGGSPPSSSSPKRIKNRFMGLVKAKKGGQEV